MLCKKCGTEVQNGIPFCPGCGNNILENNRNSNFYENTLNENISYSEYSNDLNQNMYESQMNMNRQYSVYENNTNENLYTDISYIKQDNNANNNILPAKKKRGLIAGVIISIVMLIVIVVGTGVTIFLVNRDKGRSSNDVVKCFIDAVNDCDVEKIMSVIPEKFIDYTIKEGDYSNKKEVVEDMKLSLEELRDEMLESYGDNSKITYKIIGEDNKKDYIDEINEFCELQYGCKVAISDYKKVNVKISIRNGKDYKESESIWLAMIKIDDSWYLLTMYPYYD